MIDWIECTLEDIGEIVGGATPSTKREDYYGGNIPWITPKDLSSFKGRYISNGERNITEEGLASCSAQMMPPNTVLFTSRAPIGYVAIAAQSVCTNQGFKSIVVNENADPLFVYYLLKYNKDAIEAMGSGTTFKEVSGKTMRSVKVRIPSDVDYQKRIATLLNSIDTKIEINEQINDNLEQQAELLYHERFETVDRDKLPVGWRIVRLGDVATISKKSFNPAKEPQMLLEHYSIPAFDEAHFPVFEPSTAIKSNKFIVDDSCFMISKLNPTTKRVWKPYCLTENAVCSTEFIVYKAKSQEITDFLYSVIDSDSFSDFMCSHVTGSTGSRQRTTPSDTLAFELFLPNAEEIAEYQGIVSPILEQIKCNAIENDRLKQLRDSLLPKLMSGEIDVSGIRL